MRNKITSIIKGAAARLLPFCLFAFLPLWLTGCSSSDDDDNSTFKASTFSAAERPTWQIDLSGNAAAPSWTAPDPTKFESSMFILVKLQDELKPYSTDGDLMTVFINDECRAVPAVRNVDDNGDIYFVLKIRGNGNDRDVNFGLCYYCPAISQLFILEGRETFVTEVTYGYDEDFEPPLLIGCRRYPVKNYVTASLPAQPPFTPDQGDVVAAFVGNECRGVGAVGQSFVVLRTDPSETVTLRYYSARQGGVYTLQQTVELNGGEDTHITLAF